MCQTTAAKPACVGTLQSQSQIWFDLGALRSCAPGSPCLVDRMSARTSANAREHYKSDTRLSPETTTFIFHQPEPMARSRMEFGVWCASELSLRRFGSKFQGHPGRPDMMSV